MTASFKVAWYSILGLVVLSLAAADPAAAQDPEVLVFDGNIVWNCGDGAYNGDSGGADCPGGAYTTTQLATQYFTHNSEVDPQLVDPHNLTSPDWSPSATSPALCENGASVVQLSAVDGWFQTVSYAGALGYTGSSPEQDWTQDWTYYNYDGGLGRDDIDTGKPTVMVSSDITTNTLWTSANNYEIVGRVGVDNNSVLTIEPGTVVMGSGVGSYLVIERGSDLVALGTRDEPIVFTSSADFTAGEQFPGDWGGVVIHGRALANCAVGGAIPGCNSTATGNDCESEGGAGFFGGDDDNDSSGIIRYARVEYAGQEISPNNELNAWTFNAVGQNTTIEYLQAHLGTDDGLEWFGGNARCRWLVATGNQDDNIDWQMGFRGRIQYAVVQQTALLIELDKAIEADNNEYDFNCVNRSNPFLSNLTLIGASTGTHGIHLRRGTAGTIVNSIIADWTGYCFRVQHEETFANCPGDQPPLFDCNIIGVDDSPAPPVSGFAIAAAPNPVFSSSTFSFSLQDDAEVRLSIYDATGRLVEQVFSGELTAGEHAIEWAPQGASAGVYYYRAIAGREEASGKLLVLD
jgi:hypothetical protein